MDEVLELAAKLSRAISNSERFQALRRAEAAVVADREAVEKIRKREEMQRTIHEKERKGEPVEVAEKRELAALDEFVKTHPLLAELSRAQADFQEMLNLVNSKITAALNPPEKKDDAPKEADPPEAGT